MTPAYSTCLQRKIHGCGLNSVVLALFNIVVLLHQVSCEDFTIDTNECFIQNSSYSILVRGDLLRKSFTGPNGDVWNYTVVIFVIPDEYKTIFNSGNHFSIKGNRSLSLNATGDFTITSMLDVRGRSGEALPYSFSWLGGFIRTSNSCCVLGAGPGGAFSFHGGGHGGKGGGFYQDRNTSQFYGWGYSNFDYVMGGSTGTKMFSESKPGSGGGAIELISHGGTLTVDAVINADGYSSLNTTTDDHCAGGSAGGLIRLQGKNVVLNSKAKLSAKGGNSGFSHKNANSRCGDGGGGGVIQILAQHDITDYRTYISRNVDVRGGQGLAKGEEGDVDIGFVFKEGDLDINTTSCTMKWSGILLHKGSLSSHSFKTPDGQMTVPYRVCTFEFISSVYIQRKATLNIRGQYSLKIESKNGGVQILTKIIMNKDRLGAFRMMSLDGKSIGPGKVTNCSATGLYGNDFTSLIGGSVCNIETVGGSVSATGGASIEIRADNGDIIIGEHIIADGISNNAKAGAMGGTIRLVGTQVHLKSNAYLSAKASSIGESLACGGIIQVISTRDIQGLCETKFNVSGGCNGMVHVSVSAKHSFQVQYILNGFLTINTAQCRWSHQQNSNYMVYTQKGMITNDGVCLFNFQIPIIVNGSAIVELLGNNALKIYSTQGIYIGSSFRINYSSLEASTMQFLGGYCVVEMSQGKGPGKGFPDIAAGGGHGGRGGNFREKDNFIYGGVYGVQPFSFTGGSTGTSLYNSPLTACGGGAICIESRKNLTINAHITVNGYVKSSSGYVGGSSGGTIVLVAKSVILGDNAVIEAKGSDGINSKSSGGGGGVIAINTTAPLVGQEPNVSIAAAGGSGLMVGESGVVLLNGRVKRQQYNPGVEIGESYWGCYKVTSNKFAYSEQMLEHEAIPSQCLEICREKAKIALIKGKLCACMNDETFFEKMDSNKCSLPCRGTYQYQCGGRNSNVYSTYKTGLTFSTTPQPSETPTTRPFGEPSQEFKELKNVNISGNNSREVLKKLSTLTKESDLNGGDTQAAAGILAKLATADVLEPKNTKETEEYGKFVGDTISNLLGAKNTYNWAPIDASNDTKNEKLFSPNELLNATETIGINLGKRLQPNEQVTVESSNLVMEIVRQDLSDAKAVTFPKYVKLSKKWQFQDSISISEEPFNQLKEQGIQQTTFVVLFYNDISKTLKRNLASDKMINSKILALKFEHPFTERFKDPVKLKFSKQENWKNLTNPQCSFLDFNETQYGDWSNEGFVMTSSEDNSIVICECDHLTNFAVLMQVKEFTPSRSHQKALQMITYIGCGISLFGLALTLATFLSLETLASERTSIHKNLVVAIGLAQIIFLAGIDAVYNPIACKIVALSLHYLYMAAFTWMCCEGIHLYTKVIEVFSSETSKMKYYYMLGWGVPLIIVIISAASRMSGYGTETACWISIKHGLIWAFVGPVLIIMSINFVVMVMVIKVIIASVSAIQTPGNTSQVKAGLKGMVVLLPLLGLTWVFGLMAVNEKTIVFQYIFAILNSLQGLFIFAFHCIGNSEVRVAYKRLHEKRTLAKMPEHSLSSGNHHREFKRRMNSRETNSTGDEDIIVTKAIRSVSDVKLSGAHDHVAMQTFGDADSGRWSLNCPSPDPPSVSYQPAVKSPKRDPRSPPVISNESLQQPKTPRESYRSNRNDLSDGRNRFVKGDQGQQFNGYQRF